MNWPDTILDMLGIYGTISNYLQLDFSLSCLLDKTETMFYKLTAIIFVPVIIVVLLGLFWVVAAKLRRRKTFLRVHL
jgi:hypothetical protein